MVVCYLFRFPSKDIGYTDTDICRILDITEAALPMRKANFAAAAGQGGLSPGSALTRCVYGAMKDVPEEHHRVQVLAYLDWKQGRDCTGG